jgi:hypothetical protein
MLNEVLLTINRQNWNFTVEHQFLGNSLLSVAYVGHRGLHAWAVQDANQAAAGSTYANPGVNVAALVPYKGYSEILMETSNSNSMYNSLQITWTRRFTNGLGFSAAYTLAKSMDDGSSYSSIVPDTYNTTGAPIFTPPVQGTFNLQPGVRNAIYGPDTQDWNAGLFKTFQINERNRFEFRAEAYDVFNHPNWSSPSYNAATSTFGKVTSKSDLACQLQLSLRYSF